jgi:hypothetical protein
VEKEDEQTKKKLPFGWADFSLGLDLQVLQHRQVSNLGRDWTLLCYFSDALRNKQRKRMKKKKR